MPDECLDVLRFALATLNDLLTKFPRHPALLDAAGAMDLPDELWLGLRVMDMPQFDRDRLRDFLLIHAQASVVLVDGDTLVIGGNQRRPKAGSDHRNLEN